MLDRKTKNWILFFAALFIVCVGTFLLIRYFGGDGHVAVIRVDGEVYERIDLDAVVTPYDLEIDTEYGYNKIHVAHGEISVADSDCRDHICIEEGAISSDGLPIICMPHHLTIEIEGDEIDG